MRINIYSTISMVICIFVLSACRSSQAKYNVLATTVEHTIFLTQTLKAAHSTPTLTLKPTATPTKESSPTASPTREPSATASPTRKPTSTPSSTPLPGAIIASGIVSVYEGPDDQKYPMLGTLNENDELDVIGQFGDCSWIKIVSRYSAMTGWIMGDRRDVNLNIDCGSLPLGTFRPLTGVIKPDQHTGGYGEFTVENGTITDGVVILTINEKSVIAVYIRAGDTYTIKGIRDGIYYLYFSTGLEWNGKEFTIDPTFQKFEDPFEFTTLASSYTTWSITLHGVVGGTAAAENVSKGNFPDIGQ